jgi:hypothetical protein
MDADKIGPVVLGAALTLLATLLVQAVIVPWVQVRARRREHWEGDVREVADVLEVNLPRKMLDFRTAAHEKMLMKSWQRDPAFKVDEGFNKSLSKTNEDVWHTHDIMEIEMHRLRVLSDRLHRLHRSAPYWKLESQAEQRFSVAFVLASISPTIDEVMEPEDWDKLWDKVEKAHEEFSALIGTLANSMKPPKRHLVRRAKDRLVNFWVRIRSRQVATRRP